MTGFIFTYCVIGIVLWAAVAVNIEEDGLTGKQKVKTSLRLWLLSVPCGPAACIFGLLIVCIEVQDCYKINPFRTIAKWCEK